MSKMALADCSGVGDAVIAKSSPYPPHQCN
jgi:hypothetical protein